MNYYNDFYITRDNKLTVEFLFVDLGYGKGWRAYILSDINYQRRSYLRSDAQTEYPAVGYRYRNTGDEYRYFKDNLIKAREYHKSKTARQRKARRDDRSRR